MTARKLDQFANGGSVKRLLRHRQSRAYFCNGQWTRNPEEADNFPDVVRVAEACVQYGLSDVEMALRLQTANCDLFCTPIR
jgi:hypothetical protein